MKVNKHALMERGVIEELIDEKIKTAQKILRYGNYGVFSISYKELFEAILGYLDVDVEESKVTLKENKSK